MNIANRKQTGFAEWYAPAWAVEAAREVMGGIDLDPATSEAAQGLIQASAYWTAETNGLDKPWAGRVWFVPPYRRLKGQFCERLAVCLRSGEVTEAVAVLSMNLGQWFDSLRVLPHALFVPSRPVKFWTPTDDGGKRESGAFVCGLFHFRGAEPATWAEMAERHLGFAAAMLRRQEGIVYHWGAMDCAYGNDLFRP